MDDVHLFKIFYDEASRRQIEPEFLPLDNSNGPPGWFELWPILQYLESHDLEDNHWYGFFSPKFPGKAFVTIAEVRSLLAAHPEANVALFSYDWPSVVVHRNAFVQGESFHPGLIAAFEGFLAAEGEKAELREAIGDFQTTVFSNYVVAKRAYWLAWRRLARAYYNWAAAGATLPDNAMTQHNDQPNYPLRVFVQERLSCWLLQRGGFKVVHPDYTRDLAFGRFIDFRDSRTLRVTLRWTETSKRLARRLEAPRLMALYWVCMRLTGVFYRLNRLFGL